MWLHLSHCSFGTARASDPISGNNGVIDISQGRGHRHCVGVSTSAIMTLADLQGNKTGRTGPIGESTDFRCSSKSQIPRNRNLPLYFNHGGAGIRDLEQT